LIRSLETLTEDADGGLDLFLGARVLDIALDKRRLRIAFRFWFQKICCEEK
jgi:hypothetical protein